MNISDRRRCRRMGAEKMVELGCGEELVENPAHPTDSNLVFWRSPDVMVISAYL